MKNEYAFILLHHYTNDINVNAVMYRIYSYTIYGRRRTRAGGCFMDSKIITITIMIIVLHNGKKLGEEKTQRNHSVITIQPEIEDER